MRWACGGADELAVDRLLEELAWGSARVQVMRGFCERLLGFTVRAPKTPQGRYRVLVFPNCAAVHTCFMGFELDIAFADAEGALLASYENVRPWRFLSCPGAALVAERASVRAD